MDLLCTYNNDGRQEDKGPEYCQQTVAEEPGYEETVLMFVPQCEGLSPAGGEGKEGGILSQSGQPESVEQCQEAEQRTWVVSGKLNLIRMK